VSCSLPADFLAYAGGTMGKGIESKNSAKSIAHTLAQIGGMLEHDARRAALRIAFVHF